MSIFNFVNLSIHEIQQLACWLVNQLHSDAEAAQIQETVKLAFCDGACPGLAQEV